MSNGAVYLAGQDSVGRYDTDGNLVWSRSFDPEALTFVSSVDATPEGVVVVGEARNSGPGSKENDFDGWADRYEAGGNLSWTTRFGSTGSDQVLSAAVAEADVYMAGITHGSLVAGQFMGRDDAFLRRYGQPPAGLDPCPTPDPYPFVDVASSSFAYDDIGCIYALGITTGTSATTYDPSANVTSEQAAAFMARLHRTTVA